MVTTWSRAQVMGPGWSGLEGGLATLLSAPAWLRMPEEAFHERYRPAGRATSRYLSYALLRALGPAVADLPNEGELRRKPLVVDLVSPLPRRLRFYLYEATQHSSERQKGTFKVQLTSGRTLSRPRSNRFGFDRTDGVRPILAGYHPESRIFVLWDAELHDYGDGFPFSKNVQASPDIVWSAAARGLAHGDRRLRKPHAVEIIVAARPWHIVEALEQRISFSNQSLCNGTV